MAKNKARRHITMSQIATAVVAVYQWRPGAGRPEKNSAPGAEFPKTTKELAEIAGVGTRTIEQAKTVEAKATPEVKAAVKSGAMSVKKAAETVNPPKEKEVTREPVECVGSKVSPRSTRGKFAEGAHLCSKVLTPNDEHLQRNLSIFDATGDAVTRSIPNSRPSSL